MKPVVLIVMTLVVVGAMVLTGTGLQVAPTADSVKLVTQESCGDAPCITQNLGVGRTDQFMVSQAGNFTGASFKIIDGAGAGSFSCRLNVDVTWSPGDGYSRRGEATFTFVAGTSLWYTVPAFPTARIALDPSKVYTVKLSTSFCDGGLLGWYRVQATSEPLYDVWGIPPEPGDGDGDGDGDGVVTPPPPANEPPPPVTPGFDALLVVAAVLAAFTIVLIKRR